jgi:hypothetical protein
MKNAEKEHTGKANKKPYGNENNIKHGQSKTVFLSFFFILLYFAELALCFCLYLFILIDFVGISTSFSGFSLS